MGPEGLAGGGVEALHNFLVRLAVVQDEAVVADGRGAVAGPDRFDPELDRAAGGPLVNEIGFG